ncbi:DUF6585 family protein [Pseudofrankia sp. DC12]|uniref:DUF6585 family protein n=1 Tax=Pseudofrankia sp. DC12 TaxID=683315 RepID=UPI0005F7B2FE|nr:DUF6585 family protein [Pseudofrankia sp. DC12]
MADKAAPAEVVRAAEARDLGGLESWHTPAWSAVVPPVLGLGMIAFGVVLCVANLTMLATVLGVLSACAGGVLIQVGVKTVEWTYVHEGGLVSYSLTRRTPQAFAWSDVVHLGSSWTKRYVNGSYTGMYGSYVFYLPQGRKISLTFNAAPRDVEKLPRHVEGRIAVRQLPSRVAWLRAGQDVDFGAFTLGPAGISVGGRDLAWPGIAAQGCGKITVRIDQTTLPVWSGLEKYFELIRKPSNHRRFTSLPAYPCRPNPTTLSCHTLPRAISPQPWIAAAYVTKGMLAITARSGETLLTKPVKKVLDFQVFFWLFERFVGQPTWQHALAQLEQTRGAS